MADIEIRTATPFDAEELLGIYSYYIENTAVTYEIDVPSAEDFRRRIEKTLKKYPYIVAERDGRITGYAYAGVFKDRAAYERSAETSIYVDVNEKRHGTGTALYRELEKRLADMGVMNAYACIASTDKDDEYLNHDSISFHEKQGYTLVGKFHKCAEKFGREYGEDYRVVGDVFTVCKTALRVSQGCKISEKVFCLMCFCYIIHL